MKNQIKVQNSVTGIVTNAEVYALEKALIESGFAMKADINVEENEEQLRNRGSRLGSAPTGSGHSNYLLGVIVRMNVKFTNKIWVEAERYHWFDITTSQSTMHRITHFDLDKAFHKYVDTRAITIMKELVGIYNAKQEELKDIKAVGNVDVASYVANQRERYLRILYTNPAGFTLTAGISTNYLQLKTMVTQRWNHRLPEWREFCDWCFTLPFFEELTGLSRESYSFN